MVKKPWLFLPPKLAHDLAPLGLKISSLIFRFKNKSYAPFKWKGVEFENPLGIAGGVDKNAEMVSSFEILGAGFIEIGTVTPEPQEPNPGVILKRDIKNKALWNKMGFPSKGAAFAKQQLQKLKSSSTPIFINIGKNRTTDNSVAHTDYIKCMQVLHPWAQAFVINISSPNTKGLRDLLKPQGLDAFLQPIVDENKKYNIPLILKLSPDITDEQLIEVINLSYKIGIHGLVLTNTTQGARQGLGFPVDGGVSGQPLAQQSLHLLKLAKKHIDSNNISMLLISAGGILSSKDVQERLDAGANLIQVYSALIFEGPLFFQSCIKKLRDAVTLK